MNFALIGFVLSLSIVALAQKPSAPPAPPAPNGQASTKSNAPVAQPKGSVDLLEGIIEDYNYNPSNKRDPFRIFVEGESLSKVVTSPNVEPMLPLERFTIDELKLVGIIWGGNTPKAMFMDPNNRTHVVRRMERVGKNRGYIRAIREGEVVIVVPFGKPGSIQYSTKILKLENAESK